MAERDTDETAHPVEARAASALADALAGPLTAGLYLVATPIGNLGDISLRALSVLARARHVACEDTRHSRRLFDHYGLTPELSSYNDHNAPKARPGLVKRIRQGAAVALVTDAGMPLVSDPGLKLVQAVQEAGLTVTCIPGPTAPLTALSVSGLPSDRFFFEGFLAPRSGTRRNRLEALKTVPATLIFFEAPTRVAALLGDIDHVFGDRPVVVAKELTKLHEGVWRGTAAGLARTFFDDAGVRGEFVVLVGPPREEGAGEADIDAALTQALADNSVRDAAQMVAEALGVPRKQVYARALELQKERGGE